MIFFTIFVVIKTLDPDGIWIRIGIQPKTLDPGYHLSHSSYKGSLKRSSAHLSWKYPPGQAAAFEPGETLADSVQLVDGGAAARQLPYGGRLGLQAGLEKTRVFFKPAQWVFWVFLGFFGFF